MINMRTLSTLLFFVIISVNSFAQSVKYSIDAGSNYSYFSLLLPDKINSEKVYSSIIIEYEWIDYLDIYDQLIQINKIKSYGGVGFYFNNNFTFNINKHLSFKTGIGFSKNIFNYDLNFSTIDLFDTKIKDSSKFINPFFTTGEVFSELLIFSDTLNQHKNINSNYSVFNLNIPLLLQIKKIKDKLLFSAGVSFSIILSATKTTEINSIKIEKYNLTSDFEQISINFHSNIEYQLYKNVFISLSYIRGVTDIKNRQGIVMPWKYKYSGFVETNFKTFRNSFNLGFTYKF